MSLIDALRQQYPMYEDKDDADVIEAYRNLYHPDKTVEDLENAYSFTVEQETADTTLDEPDPPEQPTVEDEPAEIPAELTPPSPPKQYNTPEEKQQDDDLSFQELASDTDYMEMLREYNGNRFGEDGAQQEDETNEEYLKRFLTHAREFEFNSIDLGRQLDWVRTADEEQRMKFGYLYSQLDRLPSFYEEGGTGYLSAVRDFG